MKSVLSFIIALSFHGAASGAPEERSAQDTTEFTEDGRSFDVGVYIDEGSSIEITDYDKTEKLYSLKNMAHPQTKWFRAGAEDLARAVPSVDLGEMKRTPTSIVGEQFVIESDLKLTPK